MSTRCHIKVQEGNGNVYPCMIYQHSDGYPESKDGVLSWLEPFVKAFMKGRGDDAEYFVAQILRHRAIQEYLYYEKAMKNKKKGETFPSKNYALDFLGWGVCPTNDPHGDVEYIYTVNLGNGEITYTKR